MKKRFWRIRGEQGCQTIFDHSLSLRSITDNQLKALLPCLAMKANLNNKEIVDLFVKHQIKSAGELMPVQRDGPMPRYYCGIDTVFTAVVVDEAGELVVFSGQGFHNQSQKVRLRPVEEAT